MPVRLYPTALFVLVAVVPCHAAEIGRPPAPSPVIADGPLEVTVVPFDPRANRALPPVDALLFRVSEKSVIYHRRGGLGETVIVEPEKGRNPVLRVTSKEGTEVWSWDTAARKFVGPKFQPPLDLTPKPATAAEENRYLFFALGKLAERQDVALTANNTAALAAYRRRTEEVARYIGRKGLDPRLAIQYEGCKRVEDDYQTLRRALDVRRKREQKELSDKDMEQEVARQVKILQSMLGAGKAAVGSRLKWEEVGNRTTGEYRAWQQMNDPTLFQTGLTEILNATIVYEGEKVRVAKEKEGLSEQAQREYEQLTADMRAVLDKRWAGYKALGQVAFGLPAHWPVERDRLEETRDVFAKAALLEEQAAFEAKADRRGNPLRVADACTCKAYAQGESTLSTVADSLSLARRCAEVSTLVPADPIHTPDRIELLTRAAGMANRAAWPQIGVRYLDTAFHPYALFARQLVGEVEKLNPPDADGVFRQAKLYALGGCGELAAAAELALQLSGRLSNDLDFQFNAARVLAGAGNEGQSAAHLKRAFEAGLTGREAINNPDLQHAKRGPLLRMLTPGVKAAIQSAGPQLEVTNTSAFPLTAVALRVEGTTNGRQAEIKLNPVPRINPGETVYLSFNFPQQFTRATKLRVFGNTVEGGLTTVNNVPVR